MRAQTKLMSRTEQLRPAAHGTWAWAIGPRARELGGEPNPSLWPGAQRSASLDLLLGILGQCSIHGEGSARGHGYLCAERGGSAFGRREVSAGRLSSGGCPGCPGPRPASANQLAGGRAYQPRRGLSPQPVGGSGCDRAQGISCHVWETCRVGDKRGAPPQGGRARRCPSSRPRASGRATSSRWPARA